MTEGDESIPRRVTRTAYGDWECTLWDDGNEQWQYKHGHPRFAVERVINHPTRSKWFVVDRGEGSEHEWDLCPPALSGPYDDEESAKAALLVIISSRG